MVEKPIIKFYLLQSEIPSFLNSLCIYYYVLLFFLIKNSNSLFGDAEYQLKM
ncbi:hypothetical protein C1646_686971 [Rhizophagus diaphanus]|nr:hypothetical protein C1646_686971 [Rhizophagus diaphanus] [Rhizophagus sp. MUCL 43196]